MGCEGGPVVWQSIGGGPFAVAGSREWKKLNDRIQETDGSGRIVPSVDGVVGNLNKNVNYYVHTPKK